MLDVLTEPQIWLILVAFIHAIVGVILPSDWSDDANKIVAGFFLLTEEVPPFALLLLWQRCCRSLSTCCCCSTAAFAAVAGPLMETEEVFLQISPLRLFSPRLLAPVETLELQMCHAEHLPN